MTAVVFLLHATATLGMFGLIWFVQVAHYPLFAAVGRERFVAYERDHARRTTWVVGPAMVAEAATAGMLPWLRPTGIPALWAWTGLGLVALIWLSTGLVQVPLHRRLQDGFDDFAHRALVRSNWVRTAAWTARAALVLVMLERIAL